MAKSKELSSPFATGGGGAYFEARVQSSYVTLMLTGGYAPCLPCWPISEIKLQGKIDGFDTDDLIVFVENPDSKEQRKLLGQIKHSIAITKSSSEFGEVMQAAWNDFNNSRIFSQGKDVIALLTGPLSATDTHNVQWLLEQAKHTEDVHEFLRHVQQANFSPSNSEEKLEVIKHHLKIANDGKEISDDTLYSFLQHFYLLGYDLGKETGVVLSLLHSHISQFPRQSPEWVWSRVVYTVQAWNQNAGTITPDNLPEDLLDAFKQKDLKTMPEELNAPQPPPKTDWAQHPDTAYLALALLIGSWNENNENDVKVVTQILGISYEEWLKKARAILRFPDSPLKLKNGIWIVVNRIELLNSLGSYILDRNLDTFQSWAVAILQESDPAFELPPEERYIASIHGKTLSYSYVLRKGIAEGLALIGSFPDMLSHSSQGKVEVTCVLLLREILCNADWVRWGSLGHLLPIIAEAAPGEFLSIVEQTLCLKPCPFYEFFSQKGKGIFGGNYLADLFWALEGLAWDEQYLVRVCVVLGELASHDPGDQEINCPFNSLTTILLPWLPKTRASFDTRKVAVETLLKEQPEIAWNLIIQLLSRRQQLSVGSYKPRWRKVITDDQKKGVTHEEYWQQVLFYSELAVSAAGHNAAWLSTLIDHFEDLPELVFDQLVKVLTSKPISQLPEEQRLSIWNHLIKSIHTHRRFSDAKWALPDRLITRIEDAAKQLAPTDPFYLYQHLFTYDDSDLYDGNGDWKEQEKKLSTLRETAISEIFQQKGVDGVIRFAESVTAPDQVGTALGAIADDVFERTFFPHSLDTGDINHKNLVIGFIWRRYHINNGEWCDNLDKSGWTPAQTGQFLAYLPFTKEVWNRASEWLQDHEDEYWTRADARPYLVNDNFALAIKKFIEHGRPYAAINYLSMMHHAKQQIDTNQCIQALFAARSSSESHYTMNTHNITELIRFLQSDPSVDKNELFKVECTYLPLLVSYSGAATPKTIESKLANDPEFFCELIQLIYKSKKKNRPLKKPIKKSKEIIINAWQLLYNWKIIPGTQENGAFSEQHFREWLQHVKKFCGKSGHLELAFTHIGEVLFHAPADPDGLWIHRAVAEELNNREVEYKYMRNGFKTGVYKSRGAYIVDPTGKPERELAEQFRTKAKQVEDQGFSRLATTLRGLAHDYERQAKREVDESRMIEHIEHQEDIT